MASSAVKTSLLRGLNVNSNVTGAMAPSLTFEPSIGIACGRINKLGADIRSYRVPLLESIRSVMVPSIRRNFDEGGRPKWEPLSESTMNIRKWFGVSGSQILVRSGALKRVASQINMWTVTTTTAIILDIPDKVWYGKLHQGGYTNTNMSALIRGGLSLSDAVAKTSSDLKAIKAAGGESAAGSIPARPFLVIQEQDEEAIMAVFLEWMQMRIDAAWPVGL